MRTEGPSGMAIASMRDGLAQLKEKKPVQAGETLAAIVFPFVRRFSGIGG